MKSYDTLQEAIKGLKEDGFAHDFNLEKDKIYCKNLNMFYKPKEFEVVETYRFEGMTNPDDNEVLYAIVTSVGDKGILVDAYGTYAESISPEMLEKLRFKYE
ncbi:phosphoribosylpyrophosphate synthetase [Porifericola rhodea]|uniref:phosphoribosylpyrophosphate synthetase n=1 Tax=Porifericola rhodea TaxID=930972 RepID=UPI002666F3A5|nr:phosphoribosylpyrophosphate synthetase [Porifericola rhodea]WKN31840.1 phosphoribosylpyrophosphate synthetase [Porifericola rhodea]